MSAVLGHGPLKPRLLGLRKVDKALYKVLPESLVPCLHQQPRSPVKTFPVVRFVPGN